VVPSSVTIAAGAYSAAFTVTTKPVNGTSYATITGDQWQFIAEAGSFRSLPPEISRFTVSTSSLRGGASLTGTVTLTGKAPTGGVVVSFSSNPIWPRPRAASVVPAGSTSVSFQINTSAVTSTTPVSLSVWTFNVVKTAILRSRGSPYRDFIGRGEQRPATPETQQH